MRNLGTIVEELYVDEKFDENNRLLIEFNTQLLRTFNATEKAIAKANPSQVMISADILTPALTSAFLAQIVALEPEKRTWVLNKLIPFLIDKQYKMMDDIRTKYNVKKKEIPSKTTSESNKIIQSLGALQSTIERFKESCEEALRQLHSSLMMITTTLLAHFEKKPEISKTVGRLSGVSESPSCSTITSVKYTFAKKINESLINEDEKSSPLQQVKECFKIQDTLSDQEKETVLKEQNGKLIKGLIYSSFFIIPLFILLGLSLKSRFFSSKKTFDMRPSHVRVACNRIALLRSQSRALIEVSESEQVAAFSASPKA